MNRATEPTLLDLAFVNSGASATSRHRKHMQRTFETWAAIIPEHKALEQASWERLQAVLRAWHAGATQKEIADALGVSPARVHQMTRKARRKPRPPAARFAVAPK